MSASDLQDLEKKIADNRQVIELGKCLGNLMKNKDFKQLILHGYLENEAIRLVHAKAEPQLRSPEAQASVIRDIDAIGSLRSYLYKIDSQAVIAAREADDAQSEIDLINSGENE